MSEFTPAKYFAPASLAEGAGRVVVLLFCRYGKRKIKSEKGRQNVLVKTNLDVDHVRRRVIFRDESKLLLNALRLEE